MVRTEIIKRGLEKMVKNGCTNGSYDINIFKNYVYAFSKDKRYKIKLLASRTSFSSMTFIFEGVKYYSYINNDNIELEIIK